jgi:hypothetical protein
MVLKGFFLIIPLAAALQTMLPPRLMTRHISTALYAANEIDMWKAQREQAKAALEQIDSLEASIHKGESSLPVLKEQVDLVEHDVTRLTTELLPPSGVSLAEYNAAIKTYLSYH